MKWRLLVCGLVLSALIGCYGCDAIKSRIKRELEPSTNASAARPPNNFWPISRDDERGTCRRTLQAHTCVDCEIILDASAGRSLQKSTLTGTLIMCEDCNGTDLRGSELSKTSFTDSLDNLDLRDSTVDSISLQATSSMKGLRLDGLDLREVEGADGTDWSGAILRGAILDNVSFNGASGRYQHFKTSGSVMNVGLGGTFAVGTDFRDASLINTRLGGCNLETARFDGANARDAGFSGANAKNASFRNATLEKASLYKTDAQGANFDGVQAKGAEFKEANLIGASFEGADLRGADFKDAKIDGANFKNAKLGRATWIDGKRCKKGSVGECKQ